MTYQHIELTRRDGIVELRLHTDGGSLHWGDGPREDLSHAFGVLAQDPDLRVVILTGTGDVFSGPEPGLEPYPILDPVGWERDRWHAELMLRNLLGIQAPVIAALNGPAMWHAEIPLLSDIILAADDVYLQDAGHFLFRTAPGDGLHIVMPLLMGKVRASYYLMTGQEVTARQALEMGMVNELMPRDRLPARAWELAEELARQNPLALRYTRLLLNHHVKGLFHELHGFGLALEGLGVVDEGLRQSATGRYGEGDAR